MRLADQRCLRLLSVFAGMSLIFGSDAVPAAGPNPDAVAFFETQIRPALSEHCFKCHGPDKSSGGLRLDSREAILKGGDRGTPALQPGDPDASLFIQAIRRTNDELKMPPKQALPEAVVADFVRWVKDGAVWPASAKPAANDVVTRHWAFEPVRAVEPPKADGFEHPIDRFIAAQLEKHGLKPNPPADKRTLIRRAYFDLIGLPPTPEQVKAFVEDSSPTAFEKVIDELLASPHYGERWGRHWLDVARYADTSGDGCDVPIPEAHLYRDYVLDAIGRDMPYDQFIIEQLAGDLLAKHEPGERDRDRLIATGFIAEARRFSNAEYAEMHHIIENTLATVGKGMLGMTLTCARCHDHKFDPIPTKDYYGLYGYFNSTQYPHPSTEHSKTRKNFVPLPGGGEAWAVRDKTKTAEVKDVNIQRRGEPQQRGDVAPRAFLSVIDPTIPEIPAGESGRLELARWIASEKNPLTARVAVNRIWQHHFGKGIVETSDMFGRQGTPPTHPDLLDWLANEFVRRGWSYKAMHRLILTSQAWQRSSDTDDARMAVDASNNWYWRYTRRRLDAEAMRDAVLFVSGRLKTGNPGPHPFPKPNAQNAYPYTQHKPFTTDYDHEYRTVYLPIRRLGKHPFMELFNGADPNEPTARREQSTVALQALFWMNSDFIRDNARTLAETVVADGATPAERLRQAYQRTYGRDPSALESSELTAYLREHMAGEPEDVAPADRELRAWTSVCRLLIAGNEFIYLD